MAKAEKSTRARRYKRIALWSMFFIVLSAMVLPLGGYVVSGIQEARAQQVQDTNPRANYWRAVRGGEAGYSAVTGKTMDGGVINTETSMLMNGGGQNWRQVRNGLIANYGGWILFSVVIVILLFFAKFGRMNLEHGRSGKTVVRWTLLERIVHWTVAVSFISLAVTGLSLIFGRSVLIPLMGAGGFAGWAEFAKWLHNWMGPWVFTPGVALMIILWIRHNVPNAVDIHWISKGGGMFGGEHPSAGRMNGGEKVWFWFICTVGVAAIVSGFFMDFPTWWSASREGMQLANVVHGITALLWIGMWFGHAYLGTIGTEGALEGMTTGSVDENWAKQHHNLWYEEMKKEGSRSARDEGGDSSVIKGQPA